MYIVYVEYKDGHSYDFTQRVCMFVKFHQDLS